MQPLLAEGDVVADSWAVVAIAECITVHEDDGATDVGDVLNGVVVSAELDDRGIGSPLSWQEIIKSV